MLACGVETNVNGFVFWLNRGFTVYKILVWTFKENITYIMIRNR